MPRNSHPSGRRPLGLLIVAVSALVALLCAAATVTKVGLLPPRVEKRDFTVAGAVAHAMVDSDRSRITDRSAQWDYFQRLRRRADVIAQLMASAPALDYIARRAHIPADQIAAYAYFSAGESTPLTEPGSEQRARQVLLARRPYRLEIQYRAVHLIDVAAQGPGTAQAERLADAAILGVQDYLRAEAVRMGFNPHSGLRLVQLGPARGAVLSGRVAPELPALTFVLAFALAYGALRWLVAIRLGRRAARREGRNVEPAWSARRPGGEDIWPRTTRVLPWMLAAFMAMLWLVPFDSIQLNVPFPIDLKLDRMVLPIIGVTWGLALAIGGRHAPRPRATWIHGAVGVFLVLAWVSVIINAEALNHSLELEVPIKKLPLLLSYVSLFLMMASVIRREEVPAFMKYTLGLAVICALGMVWEDRQVHNLFFEWSQRGLPGPFEVASTTSGWDANGRRLVHGPTMHPLAAATMLSLAFPIAVLGVIHARRRRDRVIYGLAVGVLLLGVLATQRKTGLVAPVAGILTLAHFRRRELLRLAPVAVVGVIALLIISPGTLLPVVDQFKPQSLTQVNTVDDRGSDYDAVRPDVWTHLLLGRGYGSYQPLGHRILDSELLVRLVEMGALGLVAFLLLPMAVVACARRTIHSRHPVWAAPALAGACAAMVFLLVATLFDSMAYPQVSYIFLSLAALVAVIVASPDEGASLEPRGFEREAPEARATSAAAQASRSLARSL